MDFGGGWAQSASRGLQVGGSVIRRTQKDYTYLASGYKYFLEIPSESAQFFGLELFTPELSWHSGILRGLTERAE
jgi:hypothetical protein